MNLWHVLSLVAALLTAGLFWWTNHRDPDPVPEPVAIEVPDPSVIPQSRGESRDLRFGP